MTFHFRSNFEKSVAGVLEHWKVPFIYEPKEWVPFHKASKYKPDFLLPNGILIEAKGYFLPKDRGKHLLIQEQWPDLEIRFVFQTPHRRLSKKSDTTYGSWCAQHGFQFASKQIPFDWTMEVLPQAKQEAAFEFFNMEKRQ